MSTSVPPPTSATQEAPITTTSNTVPHTDAEAGTTAITPGVRCPGGWINDEEPSSATSPTSAISEMSGNFVAAAGTTIASAGEAAAKYLPTSVVNTFAAYAPVSFMPKKDSPTGSPTTTAAQTPLTTAPNATSEIPSHSLTSHPLPEPTPTSAMDSSVQAPAKQGSQDSAPPVSNNRSIDTAQAFLSGQRTPSLTPKIESDNRILPPGLDTAQVAQTPPAMTSPATASTPSTAPTSVAPSMTSPVNVPPSVEPTNDGAPSSTISMKSGVVGQGPTGQSVGAPSPPPKDDELAYLAPHIRQMSSTRDADVVHNGAGATPTKTTPPPVKTTPPPVKTTPPPPTAFSKFQETASPQVPPHGHGHAKSGSTSSTSSVESAGRPGGARKSSMRRLKDRVRGEAKILAGKIKHDDAKIQEGKMLLGAA